MVRHICGCGGDVCSESWRSGLRERTVEVFRVQRKLESQEGWPQSEK